MGFHFDHSIEQSLAGILPHILHRACVLGVSEGRVHDRTCQSGHCPNAVSDSGIHSILVSVPSVCWDGTHPHVHAQLE